MIVAPPRIAIVGAGLMGRWHAHAAHRLGARIAAIVDCEPTRASRLASRYRGCVAVATLPAVLERVDIVHLCTPASTHLALASAALEGGRHVLVEKPLAPTAADAAQLLELAQARGVLLCPVHQFLFQDGVQRALALRSTVGPLRHLDLRICSAGAEGVDEAARQQIAVDILVHPIALVERMLAPLPGDGGHWAVRCPAAGEIRVLGNVGEVSTAIAVSTRGRPTVNQLHVIGERGTVHVDLFHGFSTLLDGRVSRQRKATQPFTAAAAQAAGAAANALRRAMRREPAYPGLRELIAQFYNAAAGRAPHPIPPAEVLAVARTHERFMQACTDATGR